MENSFNEVHRAGGGQLSATRLQQARLIGPLAVGNKYYTRAYLLLHTTTFPNHLIRFAAKDGQAV